MQTFFLAMLGRPEVQEKAHKELDAVVGSRRLPTFEDLDSLPYVTAVIKETARWQVVTPIGLPHRTIQDDEYNGYFIPEGCWVLADQWFVSLLLYIRHRAHASRVRPLLQVHDAGSICVS